MFIYLILLSNKIDLNQLRNIKVQRRWSKYIISRRRFLVLFRDDNSEELNKSENTGDKLDNQEKTEGCVALQPSAIPNQQTANSVDDFHGEHHIRV